MNIPIKFTAGDSISWVDEPGLDSLGNEITSAAWTLTYILRGSTALTLTAVANGSGWKTTISKTQSATLAPGVHHWQAVATKNDERVTLGSGSVTVLTDLAYTGTATAFDGRTQAEADLDAVRAAMRAIVSGGAVAEYSIGNRSLKKLAMADLIALETKLKADVASEKRRQRLAQGLDSGRAVYVRFGGR